MKNLVQSIKESEDSKKSHNVGKNKLLSNGFSKGRLDTLSKDGQSYVVRAHNFITTPNGKALIIDFMDLANMTGCKNVIVVDPRTSENMAYAFSRMDMVNYVSSQLDSRSKNVWVTSKKDKYSNPELSSCVNVLIEPLKQFDWVQEIKLNV